MTTRSSVLEQLFAAGDAGDLQQLSALLHENVIAHAPFGLSTVGRDAERESWRRARAAIPDLRHDFQALLRDESLEAARCVVTGTFTGEYGELRAEAAPFRVDQGLFARIENGRIVELWEIVDTESLLNQLRKHGRPQEMEETMPQALEMADQIRRAFWGESWHGPSVREVLAGVSAEDAAAHPIAGAHSIWEIVLHLTSGYRLVLRRIRGEALQLSPDEEWPPVQEFSSEAWRESQHTLDQLNQQLQSAVGAFPEERLSQALGSEYSAYTQFCGAPQHDLYHAGQIVMLKKALSARQ